MSSHFLQTVRNLAASPAEQETYLRALGTAPSADELAIEFSDALMIESSTLDASALGAVVALDQCLTEMSGPENASLWTVGALHENPRWVLVRKLATDVLERLGT